MRLLLVEDTKEILEPLTDTLISEGYIVDAEMDGAKALQKASVYNYDCIILDLNLPSIDGITIAQQLRERKNTTPIIMLTARTQVYNKIEGFKVGADDYVTKPFSTEELLARIAAVIRRSSENKENELSFSMGTLILDRNTVHQKDGEIELSTKETRILEYLIRNRGKAISAEQLLEHVWGDEIDEFTDTVKTHIMTLRRKIDPNKEALITLRGKGYMLKK